MIFISKNTFCGLFLVLLLAINTMTIFSELKRELSLMATIIYCIHDFVRPPYMMIDMQIHHWLTLILCSHAFVNEKLPWDFIKIMLKTEVSTVFLVLKNYNIKNLVVKIGFLVTFFYYRIFKLFELLFFTCLEHDEIKPHAIAYYCSLGLYGMNIYWAFKILYILNKRKKDFVK